MKDVGARFPGNEYKLRGKNCTPIPRYGCRRPTNREGPGWVNRAARVGVLLPCLVPGEWIEPPEADMGGGNGFESDEEEDVVDERYGMLRREGRRREGERVEDVEGRGLPASELAPRDRLVS